MSTGSVCRDTSKRGNQHRRYPNAQLQPRLLLLAIAAVVLARPLPLTDHNLLQAIARTNRRYGTKKDHGLIVDYIGVSKKLGEALAAYRSEDIAGALTDQDELHDKLRAAHSAVMDLIRLPRTPDVKADVKAAIAHLQTEDVWFVFRAKADAFLKAYAALSPDPRVLPYQADLKFVGAVLPYGRLHFENIEETDWRAYSEKVRAMLDEHLEVTGLKTICKLRSLTDPGFWTDFGQPEDIKTAAVRKLAELKKITTEKAATNAARYEKFSDRIKELIDQFNKSLVDAETVLNRTKEVADGLVEEDAAHTRTGLTERAYSISAILKSFKLSDEETGGGERDTDRDNSDKDNADEKEKVDKPPTELEQAATTIDELYASDETAPVHWQDKTQLRKELRGKVRRVVKDLGLDGWQKKVPEAVEHYAIQHYRKP